jgi:CheY-like chemotaxis protein
MSRVLVVEDDPHIRHVICLWLSRQGHEVLEARDGERGLKLACEQRPEVMVTDVNMPRMDGLELLAQVHRLMENPPMVIVLTNRADHDEIRERLDEFGAQVMPKPFSPAKLSKLVQELAATARRARA